MIIPKKFELAGITIDVKRVNNMLEKEGCIGKALYKEQMIQLDNDIKNEDTISQSYVHELVHWILFIMNKDVLRDDEAFVDVFAHLLYQAIKTSNDSSNDK